ncbi:hypothetical protein [Rufibacter sp. XAAS-G3-1]|uniref:hypothetical protein n=1 Tax=Rufibacter sp. XAAS-G3-1 TaxID=2729134 RepID=UPI0015E7D623|nr:hypothetical protein [Rufibacter sp. XAAS-G3-1]
MKSIYIYLVIFLLISCASPTSDKEENELAEFNFRENNPLKPYTYSESFALGFVERDTVKNGEDYRLKLFLVNHEKLYFSDSIKPLMKFHYGDSISWGKLRDSNKSVKIVEDTAFIKFRAIDESLKKGEVKNYKWYGLIDVPRPGKTDTSFVIQWDYWIQQK